MIDFGPMGDVGKRVWIERRAESLVVMTHTDDDPDVMVHMTDAGDVEAHCDRHVIVKLAGDR